MIGLNDVIRRAVSRAMPNWREKFSWGVMAAAILLFAGWYWRYGGPWNIDPKKDAQLANGWVTNCSGPDFKKFAQVGGVGPGPPRPVFKINDQLVLAVPKGNWPSAGRINHEPYKCREISDLPNVPYLYFVIQGNWSGGADRKDAPLDVRDKKVIPDAVTVRVEHYRTGLSPSDEVAMDQVVSKYDNKMADKHDVGGLTCGRFVPTPPTNEQGGQLCWVQRTSSDPDDLRMKTAVDEKKSPLVFVDATNTSKRYGGLLVYWQVWTSDLAHARDIDQAIWNSLAEWNLVSEPEVRTGQNY